MVLTVIRASVGSNADGSNFKFLAQILFRNPQPARCVFTLEFFLLCITPYVSEIHVRNSNALPVTDLQRYHNLYLRRSASSFREGSWSWILVITGGRTRCGSTWFLYFCLLAGFL